MERTASDTSASQDQSTNSSQESKKTSKEQVSNQRRIEKRKNIPQDDKLRILTQIAMYKSDKEIVEWAKENVSVSVTLANVRNYRYSEPNLPIIKRLREEFNSNIVEVEYASKRRRIEELGRIYTDCRRDDDVKNAISALREIREEVEGKKISSVNFVQNNYANMTDEEIDRKRLELIESIRKHKLLAQPTDDELLKIEGETIDVTDSVL